LHGEQWVGETNIFNTQTDEYQRQYLENATNLSKANNFTGFVVFYFRDIPGQTDTRGILRNNFTKKPAYWIISRQANSTNITINIDLTPLYQ